VHLRLAAPREATQRLLCWQGAGGSAREHLASAGQPLAAECRRMGQRGAAARKRRHAGRKGRPGARKGRHAVRLPHTLCRAATAAGRGQAGGTRRGPPLPAAPHAWDLLPRALLPRALLPWALPACRPAASCPATFCPGAACSCAAPSTCSLLTAAAAPGPPNSRPWASWWAWFLRWLAQDSAAVLPGPGRGYRGGCTGDHRAAALALLRSSAGAGLGSGQEGQGCVARTLRTRPGSDGPSMAAGAGRGLEFRRHPAGGSPPDGLLPPATPAAAGGAARPPELARWIRSCS